MGVTGFVLSMIGFFFNPFAIPSILGTIFSSIGLKGKNKGLAIAGLVLGIIGSVYTLMVLTGIIDISTLYNLS